MGNSYPSRLELIRKLQKKIIGIISFSDFRDLTSPLFKKLSILPIDDLNNEAIIQSPHQKSTKNRPAQIIKKILLNLKGVKFGTTFLHLSKTQNHLRFLRKKLKNIILIY